MNTKLTSVFEKLAQATELADEAARRTGEVLIESKDRQVVSSKEVAFIRYVRKKRHVYLYLHTTDNRVLPLDGTLGDVERLENTLPGSWARAGGYYLVNLDHVHEVSGRRKFRLHFKGLGHSVPISKSADFEENLLERLGVKTFAHLTPDNAMAKKLRLQGLYNFGFREFKELDTRDPAAVEAFKEKWDITQFPFELVRDYFKYTSTDKIDILRFVKNVLWQMYCWMSWELINQFEGDVQTLWYDVQAAVAHHSQITDNVSSDSYQSGLKDLILDAQLFQYRDLGFFDNRQGFRGVGTKHPNIIVMSEKNGHLPMMRRLSREYGVSFASSKGQPAHMSTEYFRDELREGGVDLEKDTVHLLTIADYDWAGFSIRGNMKKAFQRGKNPIAHLKTYHIIKLEEFTVEEIMDARTPGARYYKEDGEKIPWPDGAHQGNLTSTLEWLDKISANNAEHLVTKQHIGPLLVTTIWKVSADALPYLKKEVLVRQKLDELLGGEPPDRE